MSHPSLNTGGAHPAAQTTSGAETPEAMGARFAREADARLHRLQAEVADGFDQLHRSAERLEAAILKHLGGAA